MATEVFKKEFLNKYIKDGEEKFYRFLLIYALNKLILISKGNYKGISPDQEFLNYYDRLIISYRREGDEIYLNMSRVLRKAAHKIYRVMLKKNMTQRNYKFLNLV